MSAPARFYQYIHQSVSSAIFGPQRSIPSPEEEQPNSSRLPMQQPGQFQPFLADVLEVKNDLCKGLRLPMELVDAIVDFAEYWPHTTTVRKDGSLTVTTGNGEENIFVLRSYPLGYLPKETDETECLMLNESSFPTIKPQPWSTTKNVEGHANEEVMAKWLTESQMKSEHPCRKIVFTIKSRDQGWGGAHNNRGTYKGSSSWFDVGKEELVAFKEGQEPSSIPPNSAYKTDLSSEDTTSDMQPAFKEGQEPSSIPPNPAYKIDLSSEDTQPITCAFHTIIPRTESNQTSSDDTDIQYHFHHDLDPNEKCLQRNVTAIKNIKTHQIVWSCDDDIDPDSIYGNELDDIGRGRATGTGEFVRNMKIGDVVTVWAKARYAAWVNIVEEVKIDVYWAV